MTPSSSPAGYGSPAGFVLHYDATAIAQLAQDVGVQLMAGQVATSPIVAALLLRASGEIEAAALVGQRYQPADLAALTGSGQAFLEGLVYDRAYARLELRRKGGLMPGAMPGLWVQTEETLKAIRSGEAVFGLLEAQAAGAGMELVEPAGADPSPAPRRAVSDLSRRFFGRRD